MAALIYFYYTCPYKHYDFDMENLNEHSLNNLKMIDNKLKPGI